MELPATSETTLYTPVGCSHCHNNGYLGRTGCYVADIIARIACLIVLYFLVQKSFDKALDAYEYEDVTNKLLNTVIIDQERKNCQLSKSWLSSLEARVKSEI